MSEETDLQEKLAIIEARKAAFARSPAWFIFWDRTGTILKIVFWLGFWSIVAQCECKGCIW